MLRALLVLFVFALPAQAEGKKVTITFLGGAKKAPLEGVKVTTGTVWKSAPAHEPILWRHVSWGRQSPDREVKEQSRWGWLFYRRVKTGKAFYRPMNRAVHAHIRSVMPADP